MLILHVATIIKVEEEMAGLILEIGRVQIRAIEVVVLLGMGARGEDLLKRIAKAPSASIPKLGSFMFTGIIQSIALILSIKDQENLRTITLDFTEHFCSDLAIGASVSVDGVCLTVTKLHTTSRVDVDVMLQTLMTTTLREATVGMRVNVERAAKAGAEIGGHVLSGHIDFCGNIIDIQKPENNYVLTIEIPPRFMRYIFSKGYIALNGTSLTISELNRDQRSFQVWLIPETLQKTTWLEKNIHDLINVEIDRNTQVIVDTVRTAVEEQFELLREQGLSLCAA